MAAVADALLCPACGARNKPKWEFCVRCGESLQDAQRAAREEDARLAADAGVAEDREPLNLRGLVGPAVVIACAAAAVYMATRGPAKKVDPALFALPPDEAVLAASRPPVEVKAPVPSATAFDEGVRLLRAGQARAALPYLAEAVGQAPDDPRYRNTYGQALWEAGERERAVFEYEAATRLDTAAGTYRFDLGRALAALGRSDDALRQYQQGLETQPGDAKALEELAYLHVNAGRPQDALPLMERLAGLRPGDPVVQTRLGDARDRSGDLEGAAAAYRAALEAMPGATVARGLLGDVLFRQGQKDEALALLRTGVEQDPNSAVLRKGFAGLLERSGQLAEAAREYREYVRLAPSSPEAAELVRRAESLESRAAAAS